jgi:predicted amidohydrolase
MKKRPVIALAQIKYFDFHRKDNVEKVMEFIRLAKKSGADIVCFPESCLHKTDTLSINDPFIKEIRLVCQKNSIWCIINEEISIKGTPFNMALLIDRNGEIAGTSKKIHLYGDGKKVQPGKKIKVFDTDFGSVGIVICWDLTFPELFKKMKDAGAQIVFCPSAWCYEGKAYGQGHKTEETRLLRSLIRARAFENLYFVAMCNPVLARKDQVSYSAICSPQRILKEIIDEEGLITARINVDDIGKLKKLYKKN